MPQAVNVCQPYTHTHPHTHIHTHTHTHKTLARARTHLRTVLLVRFVFLFDGMLQGTHVGYQHTYIQS